MRGRGNALGRPICVAALGLTTACYTGVSSSGTGADDGESAGSTDGAESGVEEGSSGSETGDPADPDGVCEGDVSTGLATLRRLTRRQYDNTIRDLLGLDADADARLDADERVGPFTSNSIIPVTERLVDQYMTAAEELAELKVADDLAGLVPCAPASGDAACASEFIATFGRRAFRRPLTTEEIAMFEDVYALGAEQGGFESGIQLALEGMLQSPSFLYMLEFGGTEPAGGGELVALEGYEIATRLSYFLWNSTPDDALLDAAENLGDPQVLEEQARRLLADAKARDAIATFHSEWVGLHNLGEVFKDPVMFPDFDDATKAAMAAETARFAEHVFFEGDGRLETLLTAPYSLIDEPLFAIYGIEAPADHDPSQPVQLDATQRGGLLTQPGFLAVHAHHNQTSPVHRGVAIRRNFLCQDLPAPPPEVDNTPPEVDPNSTTRERFDQHKSDPTCAGCHVLIDDLGLSFEHYDPVGAWRTMDGIGMVDASGKMLGAEEADGEFYGALELSRILADSDVARECVAQQWFRFAFGRSTGDNDTCALDQMYTAFAESDFDIRELLVATIMSPSFRYLRVEEGGA